MEIDLNELERLAKAATPGKWTWKQVGCFNTPGCAVFWPDMSKGGVHCRGVRIQPPKGRDSILGEQK